MTNIEAQKLWFIEQILRIDNLTLLDGLKDLFVNYTSEFKPMTWKEL